MAEILSKHPATNRFQVVHFAHAKRFGEAQRASKHPAELLGQANPPLMLPHRLVEKYNDQIPSDRWLGFPKIERGIGPRRGEKVL
jgi:hypothetical protein